MTTMNGVVPTASCGLLGPEETRNSAQEALVKKGSGFESPVGSPSWSPILAVERSGDLVELPEAAGYYRATLGGLPAGSVELSRAPAN